MDKGLIGEFEKVETRESEELLRMPLEDVNAGEPHAQRPGVTRPDVEAIELSVYCIDLIKNQY